MNRKPTFAKRQRETDLKERARAKQARGLARAQNSRAGKGPEIAWGEMHLEGVELPPEEARAFAAARAAEATTKAPAPATADEGPPPPVASVPAPGPTTR